VPEDAAARVGLPYNFGFGLASRRRRGFAKILHVDIAFPLDGNASIDDVQILVESKRSF
jgi:hypothetical protein